LHRMHSALEVAYRGHSIMIDCGADWLHRVHSIRTDAIILTHAHPDHAGGLQRGAPCPVYATEETWRGLEGYPVTERVTVAPRAPFFIYGIAVEAFRVEHSIRAPAAGYRVTAGRRAMFYAPDLVYIYEQHEALAGIQLYVGDGASLRRPLVRRRGEALIGHADVRTQLEWCREEGVKRALITHCGSQIVGALAREMDRVVHEMGLEQGVDAGLAFDGLEVILR